jgi:fumarate reductase subunit D
MKRSFTDFKTNWKSTVLGILTLIVTLLVSFGVITTDQSTVINAQTGNIVEAVSAIIVGVTAILNIFKFKDE